MAESTRTRKLTLTQIGVLSLAKIQAIIGAVVGLIVGVIQTLVIFTVGTPETTEQQANFVARFGGFAIIFSPIFYGIIGFIGGAITAFVYNLVAKWIGGIVLEFKQE
jgi:hypothetical protein